MISLFVDKNIAKAKTLSKEFYTDTKYFVDAKEKIFSNCLQFIGDTSLLKEPGSCYPFMFLDGYINEPLLLTRDKLNHFHCLSNVCTHRGNILVNQSCKASNIRCKYHGRLFDLDGKFRSMPEFKEVKNFPSPDDDLQQLPLFKWNNWLFASLNKKIFAKKLLETS